MLTIEAPLPLTWRIIDAAEVPSLARQFNAHNEDVLRVLQLVETSSSGELREEGGGELHRIEAKLDMLVGMLSELLASRVPLPAPVPGQLNAESITLVSTDPIADQGAVLALDVFLNPRLMRPLCFVARVDTVTDADSGFRVRLEFLELAASVREELERQIFLLHRRELRASSE